MRRAALVALAALVVALSGVAPARATDIAPYSGAGARKVVLFGDSLSVQTQATFTNLTGASYQTSYNATSGYAMYNWIPALPSAMASSPDAIEFALGVNDYHVGGQAYWWQQAMNDTAGRCRVWVEFYQPNIQAIQFANQVRPIVKNAGGRVYNWNAQAQLHPSWFQSDKTHLTAAGITAYANALNAAQALC